MNTGAIVLLSFILFQIVFLIVISVNNLLLRHRIDVLELGRKRDDERIRTLEMQPNARHLGELLAGLSSMEIENKRTREERNV